MPDSLKDKTISGLKWSGIEKVFQQLFIFVSGILLARTLNVEDYGLVAVLSIFTYMANALQDSGFPAALIRKKNVTEDDYNTTFYFNVGVALFLYILLFICAPLIGSFYEKPQLVWLSKFIFLSFLFNALGAVHSTQIIKSINYKLNAKISISVIIISYSLALTLAFTGFGPWALAVQAVSMSAFRTIFLWIFNKWRPQLVFSMSSFRELFGFGSNLLIKSILDTITTQITPNVIAKSIGLYATGLYDNGRRLYNSGQDFLSGTILNVAYPVLSKVEGDKELKRVFRKIVRTSSFLIFPFFLGMALVARPFIVIAIGEKWIAAVEVLQLLSMGGMFISLNALWMHIIKIKGKPRYILITEVVYTIIVFVILSLSIILKWNIYYIVAGIVCANIISCLINFSVTRKLIGYRIKELLKDVLPYFCIILICVTVGYSLKFVIGNILLLLIAQILTVALLYFGITYFSGSKIIKDLISVIKTSTRT